VLNERDVPTLVTLLQVFCYFMALPLKVRRGSGSPVRGIALIPKEG